LQPQLFTMGFNEEIKRRRTFAIISHPDAGKTTLTEKLLLFGGAIHVAGAVKSNKIKKTATSDFMEIERQRGISVATSVMGFDYDGAKINILDTPGHQDFAEDTFRTLTAVDSVIVVVDAAKGVEPQTKKLMEVCRMRKTPVIVFINKVDREGRDPFDILDEIEEQLQIKVRPLSWPVGMGQRLKGVYNIFNKKFYFFSGEDKTKAEKPKEFKDLNDPGLDIALKDQAQQLRNDLELVEGVYPKFNLAEYQNAETAPVFFGSALYNFGVQELLESFIHIAPHPKPSTANERMIDPFETKFSGFVFKIHANMDPNHRDRIAFVKICSGTFRRNTNYYHVRLDRNLKFASPTAFMADKKSIVEEAFPGDIIGLHDTGNFKIGDTLTEGEVFHFKGLPSFSPEMFRYIENGDPMKTKQLNKGIDQLMDEGVAQLFTLGFNGRKIIGCVGQLQFEVIEYRLLHEYTAKCRYEQAPLYKACWVRPNDMVEWDDFKKRKVKAMAKDKHGRDVYLAESAYDLQMAQSKFKGLEFFFTSEF